VGPGCIRLDAQCASGPWKWSMVHVQVALGEDEIWFLELIFAIIVVSVGNLVLCFPQNDTRPNLLHSSNEKCHILTFRYHV
jgi:hypothetical protein